MSLELGHTRQKLADTKDELETQEKKAWETEMRKRVLEKDFSEKERKLRKKIAELEKLNTMIQNRDNQYRHEIRKREKDFRDLQEKLVKAMSVKVGRQAGAPATQRKETQRNGMEGVTRNRPRRKGARRHGRFPYFFNKCICRFRVSPFSSRPPCLRASVWVRRTRRAGRAWTC